MKRSEQINELATALAKAQAKMGAAKKTKWNPFFKSHYADLEDIWTACRGPLTENGLSIIQVPAVTDRGQILEPILMHSSGQWISGEYLISPSKTDPQGVGSAITYGRRYSVGPMTGVITEEDDDDGEAAMGRPPRAVPVAKWDAPKKVNAPSDMDIHSMLDTQLSEKEVLRKRSVEFWTMVRNTAFWSDAEVKDKLTSVFKKEKIDALTDEEFWVLWGMIETNPKKREA